MAEKDNRMAQGSGPVVFSTRVFCTFTFEATHHWPGAPPGLPESYLQNLHRHTFHVRAEACVTGDREIEFIALRRKVETFVRNSPVARPPGMPPTIGARSCETIAALILTHIECLDCVEVSEDGENGAVVSRTYEVYP